MGYEIVQICFRSSVVVRGNKVTRFRDSDKSESILDLIITTIFIGTIFVNFAFLSPEGVI